MRFHWFPSYHVKDQPLDGGDQKSSLHFSACKSFVEESYLYSIVVDVVVVVDAIRTADGASAPRQIPPPKDAHYCLSHPAALASFVLEGHGSSFAVTNGARRAINDRYDVLLARRLRYQVIICAASATGDDERWKHDWVLFSLLLWYCISVKLVYPRKKSNFSIGTTFRYILPAVLIAIGLKNPTARLIVQIRT